MVSQSANPVVLIRFRIDRTYAALVRQFTSIQKYPTLRPPMTPAMFRSVVKLTPLLTAGNDPLQAPCTSDHAAITDEMTLGHISNNSTGETAPVP